MDRQRILLIVDDDRDLAESLGDYFRATHAVRVACSESRAIDELTSSQPDVLICDYDLGSVTSERVLKHAAQVRPGMRRIVFSGAAAARRACSALADSIVDKPLVDHLIKLVHATD
jgi:DNA-binding NtrC family response regulator